MQLFVWLIEIKCKLRNHFLALHAHAPLFPNMREIHRQNKLFYACLYIGENVLETA